jgi:hypothetical protein
MFESHYKGLDRMALSGGWAPGISDDQCDELELDYATFARDMANAALKDLELLPQDESGAQEFLGPQIKLAMNLSCCNNSNEPYGYQEHS